MAIRSLVAPTSNPMLEKALLEKVQRRNDAGGRLGELEPLAIRFGLMQRTLKPRFREPQLMIFAADHGIAVEGLQDGTQRSTSALTLQLLKGQLPLSVFARIHGLQLSVVDCGVAENLPPHDQLLARKIAHGTRNARMSSAMSIEQAHAAMRAGMELGDQLRGNAVALAGLGVGANESAAIVLAKLAEVTVRDLLGGGTYPGLQQGTRTTDRLHGVIDKILTRHFGVTDPVEALAALGGFEVAMMCGVMLMAASKRHLLLVDGLPAIAALLLASRIAEAVTDYCVFCRSHRHRGIDKALSMFHSSALMELGLDSMDGIGSALAWPLVRSAAALLTEVADGEDPGPSWPAELQDEEPAPAAPPSERLD